MSINDTISQTAATNPTVGVAVSDASIKSAILAGMQTGDTMTASVLGAADTQAQQANQLLASMSGVGGHLNITA